MFCAPGLVFGVTEGVGSRFHVWHARTRFRRCRGRRVTFSCFAIPSTFSEVRWASCTVFMLCGPGLIFGGSEGVGSRFHVLRSRTRFRRYRGRRVPFSCFALSNLFSAVPRASGTVFLFCAPGLVVAVPRASDPVFMFCVPELVLGGTEGDGYRFLILGTQTRFRQHRGCRVPFSCFALSDSLSALPRALGPVFMFGAPRLIFNGSEGVGSRFHVLRARTHFRRNRGRQVLFSCFALPDSFPAVPRASRPMFCAPVHVFGGTEGVRSCFHVLRSQNLFRRYRG
jgi:hypothetical protein